MPFDDLSLHRVMTEISGSARAQMNATLAAFEERGLAAGERLSAVAAAVAAAAFKRHGASSARLLRLLQDLTRPTAANAGIPRGGSLGAEPRTARVAEAIAVLDGGFDRLAAVLADAAMPREEAVLVEAVLWSRLLAEHRPHAIRFALAAVERALAAPDYRCGQPIDVPLSPVAENGTAAAVPLRRSA